ALERAVSPSHLAKKAQSARPANRKQLSRPSTGSEQIRSLFMNTRIVVSVFALLVAAGLAEAQPARTQPLVSAPPAQMMLAANVPGPAPDCAETGETWVEEAGDCCPPDCRDHVCGPPGRIWVDVEWLAWWIRGSSIPPLLTSSPAGTDLGQAGVLGAPGTNVAF